MNRLGLAFKDSLSRRDKISEVKKRQADYGLEGGGDELRARFFLLPLAVVLGALALFLRLTQLTIIEGEKHFARSENNRLQIISLPAPRGVIFDRLGEVLARNRPEYKLKIKNEKLKINEDYKIISREEALRMEAEGRGGEVIVEMEREYPLLEIGAHLIGYLGEVDEGELEELECLEEGDEEGYQGYQGDQGDQERALGCYSAGDMIGKMGVEKAYEEVLRGVKGRELVETSALGKVLKTVDRVEPVAGEDVYLTVDGKLHRAAYDALQKTQINTDTAVGSDVRGAVVVSEVETGEILVLVSLPSFDPGAVADYLEKEGQPFLNRAINGSYPPGSVFKLVTASAALEEGKIDESTEIEDVGKFQIKQWTFSNWYFNKYGKTEGLLNVVGALKRSNDIFFYRLAGMVGADLLTGWARKFGLGEISGIDLNGEESGMVPSDQWKQEAIGEPWYLGDTYHLGIGQGYLLTTPLQINMMTGVIANGGRLCRPRVSKEQKNPKSEIRNSKQILNSNDQNPKQKPDCREVGLSAETVELIKQGMRQACEPGGTGWPLFKLKIKNEKLKMDKRFIPLENEWVELPTGCKTGTAEYGDALGQTHAWFTVFAPYDEPEIVVTVLIEGGGEGADAAAPVAREILEEWFNNFQ